MFMQAYIQKLKPKLKFALTLVFAITAVFLLSKPLQTQASGYASMTESDSAGKGTTTIYGGPNWDHTGMLYYLVLPNGTKVSETVAITTNYEGIVDRKGNKVPNVMIPSKIGAEKPAKIANGAINLWGPPFEDGEPRGEEIKEWLLDTDPNGHTRAANIIRDNWGENVAKRWERKEIYLVFEPFYWNHVYINGVGTGKWFCGTTYTIGQIQYFSHGEGMGPGGTGDVMIRRYTNNMYPNCLKMEDCEEIRGMGFTAPTHGDLITNDGMGAHKMGWGIGVVWNEQEAIHTYWEDNGSPGDPEPPTSTDPPKSGDCAMVKSYYIEYRKNGRLDHYENKGTYYQKDCTNVISIDDEPNYKLEKWKISSSEADTSIEATNNARRKTWNPPSATQSGTSPALKTLQGDEQVVYVLLKKVVEETVTPTPSDINYTLKESQITKRIKLSEQDGAALATNIKDHRFKWTIVAHATQCAGHSVDTTKACDKSCVTKIYHNCAAEPDKCYDNTGDGDCDVITYDSEPCGKEHPDKKTVYCTGFQLTNKSLSFGLTNTLKDSYQDILATKWRKTAKGENTTVSKDRDSTEAQTYTSSGWDFTATLMRGKDKLTVAEWKGYGKSLKDISTSGFAVENTPQGTRKTQDYTDKFSVKFTGRTDLGDEANTTIATADTLGEGYDGDACTDTKKLTFLNSTVLAINDITVYIEVYSGTPEGGYNDTTVGKNQVQSKTISFYPYIRMRFDNLLEDDKLAFVLGQYRRSLTPNDYAQVSIGGSPETIQIDSYQWSTHAGAQQVLAEAQNTPKGADASGVLPGGATLTISTPNTKTVTVTTYQCILTSDGLTQVEKTQGSKGRTESEAESAHSSLVSSVESRLEEVEVVQHLQNKDGSKNKIIRPGTDLSEYALLTGKASEDMKYYFRSDADEVSQGDIDVVSSTTESTKYIFRAETSGDITMNGGTILNKTQTASSLSGTAKTINDKTLVVDKLVKALERNTGDDTEAIWATDGKWYNEAFDGVTVLKQVTTITVKLKDPAERMSVLDPKLTPKSSGKGDMFNKDKYMLSYYQTENIGYVGTFRGKVKLSLNTSQLFKSSGKFIIPNVTTQDLN